MAASTVSVFVAALICASTVATARMLPHSRGLSGLPPVFPSISAAAGFADADASGGIANLAFTDSSAVVTPDGAASGSLSGAVTLGDASGSAPVLGSAAIGTAGALAVGGDDNFALTFTDAETTPTSASSTSAAVAAALTDGGIPI